MPCDQWLTRKAILEDGVKSLEWRLTIRILKIGRPFLATKSCSGRRITGRTWTSTLLALAASTLLVVSSVRRAQPHGRLEPVGSHPDFRGMGLGREVVMEGIRRAAALGALKVAGGDVRFYEAIGFQKTYASHTWTKGF